MPKLIDWLFMALLQIETNGKLNSLLAKESAAICNSALNCPLRKSLVKYSKSGHFYFGETGHFYLGITILTSHKVYYVNLS